MKKKIISYLPFVFIVIIWLFFAHPFFLKDKVPFASNYQVTHFPPWSSYEKFWGPVKNNSLPDVIAQVYPWRHLALDLWKSKTIPLWNPYSFSGTPLLANYQSAVLSPFNLLFLVFDFVNAWSILVLLQSLLAGIFVYIYARTLKISKIGSLISSLSFMFCGFITIWMGYATLAYAILFLPLSLFAIEKFYQSKRIRFLILLAFTIPLSFFSGHFQISLYFFIFILSYSLYKYFSLKNLINTFYLLLFSFLGLLIAMPQVIPSVEFYTQTLRSTLFLKVEAIPWTYFPTLFVPDFFGNPVTRNVWFGNYVEWNMYIGLLPFLFALYNLFRRSRNTAFFILASIVTLIFSFDSPFINALISLHIPVLSTSAVSRIIVLFSFSCAILAGFGFDKVNKDLSNKKVKTIIIWFFLIFVLFAALWSMVVLKLFLDIDKIRIVKSNLIFPSLIILSGSGLILLNIFIKKKNILLISSVLILFIIGFDMLRFATKWQPFDPKSLVFINTNTTDYFKDISSEWRSFGNYGAEVSVYYNIPSVEGYDPVFDKRYGEFISSLSDGKIKDATRYVVALPKDGKYTHKAINLLGIKYIIHKVSDGRAFWAFPFWTYTDDQFKLIHKDGRYEFLENREVFPRAFLTSGFTVIKDKQKIIDTLFSKKFNLENEVILEENPNVKIENVGTKSANITSYKPNEVNIRTKATSNSILLLSDTYFPGWKAFVDNNETKIYRADYTFRAVYVPKGEHEIKFVYDPISFRLGVYAAIIGILGIGVSGFLLSKSSKFKVKN